MKNQWFGDIHDFRKYGLLRFLNQTEQFTKILIAWMLTPSEENDNCGKYRGYINYPWRWKKCDEELFEILAVFNKQPTAHNVRLAFDLNILKENFVPFGDKDELFLSENREQYFQDIKNEKEKCDLVFLDADNGLEVDSMDDSTKPKYIRCAEVRSLYEDGKNILIYQHRAIGQSFETQIANKIKKLGEQKLDDCPRIVFRGGNVSYILLCRDNKQVDIIRSKYDEQDFPDYYLKLMEYKCPTQLKTN